MMLLRCPFFNWKLYQYYLVIHICQYPTSFCKYFILLYGFTSIYVILIRPSSKLMHVMYVYIYSRPSLLEILPVAKNMSQVVRFLKL